MHDDNDLARKLAHLSATFAYMTLQDGVLLDVEFDAVDGRAITLFYGKDDGELARRPPQR